LPAQAAAHDRPRICNNSTAMPLLSRLSPLLLAATLLTGAGLVSSPARAALFGDDEARKAILDLRGRLAEQDKRAQENQAALNQRLDAAQRSQLCGRRSPGCAARMTLWPTNWPTCRSATATCTAISTRA
jgi:hypothetical protein